MNYAEEFKSVASFKEDAKKSKGPDDISLLEAVVTPEDLMRFQITRDLNNLTLKGDSVYLLNTIICAENNYLPITKLCLESYLEDYQLNKSREENSSLDMAKLRVIEEIEALGAIAIKQVIFCVSLDINHPVKTLKLFTDKNISDNDSETITNNPNLTNISLYNKALQIEGQVLIRIVKFFHENTWSKTETISIKCDLNQVDGIKDKAEDSIYQGPYLTKLILEEGAFLSACDDKLGLFSGRIDTLVLKCEEFPKDKLTKDQEINLMACKNLELHAFAIVILPFISSSSLNEIKEIGAIYEENNINLSSILSESNECKKILQKNISDNLEKHTIRLERDFPKSDPSERLRKRFGETGDSKGNDTNDLEDKSGNSLKKKYGIKTEDADKKLYFGLPIRALIGIIAGGSVLLVAVIALLARRSRDGRVQTRYQ
eukprot:GHVP01059307.1.p1 GENE.GHVP01059307.1~~GHVP01059307.1.p1  ORF type:complete len:431 (+),score=61.86 GHVP01059307.1:689-1981(+)